MRFAPADWNDIHCWRWRLLVATINCCTAAGLGGIRLLHGLCLGNNSDAAAVHRLPGFASSKTAVESLLG